MTTTPQKTPVYEETTEVPRGRKPRETAQDLWDKLAESAKRGVAFARTEHPDIIDELRKDLNSAQVQAKYHVTTGTKRMSDNLHKLTFSARHRETE